MCIHCDKADLLRGAVPHAVIVAGVEFATELPGQRCPACGYSTVNGPAAVRFDLLVAAELVKRGLRSGDSFKLMRKALGMKAIEIAEAFNVAPGTGPGRKGHDPVSRSLIVSADDAPIMQRAR